MEKKVYVELPPFTGRNVPITEIAAAMHKDAQYVRIGLQQGILKFGYPGSQKPFTIHTVHVKSYHKNIAGKRQAAVTLPGLGLACPGISTSPALAAIPVSMAVFRSSSAHRFLTGEASYYETYQN